MVSWLLTGVLLTALIALPEQRSWLVSAQIMVPSALLYGFIGVSAWYLCRYFPMRKTGYLQMAGAFVVSALIASSVWVALTGEWVKLIATSHDRSSGDLLATSELRLMTGAGFLLYLLVLLVHYLLISVEDSKNAERRAVEMQMLARDAELRALRSQINPHFLFNSLNSISALTSQSPDAARTMTQLLADFFRKSLSAGGKTDVPLSEEIGLITDYLEIERVRFGDRLKSEISVDQRCQRFGIPPLILQPLVENAVKHGITNRIEGGTIAISVFMQNGRVHIRIKNPYDRSENDTYGTRLGIENIRSRLAAVYGSKARLDIRRDETLFTAEITIEI